VTNTCLSLLFTQDRLFETVKGDMAIVSKIADSLVSSQVNLLNANAQIAAQRLGAATTQDELERVMREQVDSDGNFMAMTIFNSSGVVAEWGTPATPPELIGSEYVKGAFKGRSGISTTRKDPSGELVFHICVPMNGRRVLSVTIPGMFFSDLLEDFSIWDSGSIFIIDEEGTIIASARTFMVEERYNYIERAKTDPGSERIGALIGMMAREAEGVGSYDYLGEERICAYRKITGSSAGWTLGVAAPISESPAAQVYQGLFLTAAVFLMLGFIVSVSAAKRLAMPFELIKTQNAHLEELHRLAKSASEAKTSFLANMSHEMRTPLNAIIGLSELMLSADEGEIEGEGGMRDNLEKIYNSGVTLLGIVNDILDISKVESGKMELIAVEYDVPSLINDTITLNVMRMGDKPVDFVPVIDANLPSRLIGDELKVKQIFNNLLSNAFKYTKEGMVELRVTSEADGGSVWLVAAVKDTGIGIRADDMQKLFSEYNQVDVKSNRHIEGTGLGLSLAKKMAELMDGSISVESEYGQGSTFTVRLRQELATDTPIGEKVAQNLRKCSYLEQKRSRNSKLVRTRLPYAKVLIVDDVATNLDVAKGMLRPYGMQVDCVFSGQQAVDLIRKGEVRYDAIFMDHMMPGMDGIEATRLIREEIGTEYAKTVPIIALTANAIMGNEQMFLECGFQAFLPKPIDIMRMDMLIKQWVRDPAPGRRGLPPGEDEGRPGGGGKIFRDGWRVEGIDLRKAIERFGGSEGALIEALGSYARNTGALLDKLRSPSEGGLGDYAVVVHGVKGSSYGVCADDVGKDAEALERAAKAGDFAFVSEGAGAFISKAEALLSRLAAALELTAGGGGKPRRDAPDAGALTRLKAACEAYDMDGVDAAMSELEGYDYGTQPDLAPWLRERVDMMEFQQILDRLADAGDGEA
jgi:signal transduction histidine kinase/CheY-like chemotaxis protein